MRARDIAAGALLVNAIPHTITGLAGKRGMTPWGGPNSSPAANLAWAGLNLLAGVAALGPRSWRRIGQRAADERLRAVTAGTIGMAAFAAAYQLSPAAAQHRRLRADLARPAA
ncbi:MAG TPA: hypothetical protein VKV38_15150 [Trebonia sp.]|jgi:hypothetical protein|nr:hypothetical protein [Trebonia sp.]